ncbi:MAG: winged helix-turn-helix domain-containing protein [Thermoguttaceae bacterium]
MTKKERTAAVKAESKTVALEAPQVEPQVIALEAPQAVSPSREELVAKAKAARVAAEAGLIPQEQADAIWAQAEAACKPSEESLALAKAAKEEKEKAEKVAKAAKIAFDAELISEDVYKQVEANMEKAKAAYTEATKAARGFSLAGAGPRCKGQMSGLEAAFRILSESDTPLNPAAITKAAIEKKLWTPDGLTPASTLSAALQADVKKGDKARFVKVGSGLYTTAEKAQAVTETEVQA